MNQQDKGGTRMTEQQQSQQPRSLPVLTPGDPLPETMEKEFANGKGEDSNEQ